MTAYRELIERLAAATGPDTELDVDLCIAFQICGLSGSDGINVRRPDEAGWEPTDLFHDPMCCDDATPLTASIDAATRLIEQRLPKADVDWFLDRAEGLSTVTLDRDGYAPRVGQHEVPAIAFLIALLRALEAQSKDKEEGGSQCVMR